jgi:lactoylglutathione lyase
MTTTSLPIKGLYEITIRVKDLARAGSFYKEVLGLQEGRHDKRRIWLLFYTGNNAGRIVLQEDKGDWSTQHVAFTVSEADLDRAAAMLKDKGVTVSELVHQEWLNADSVYFEDPDGHALELIALPGS